MATLLITLATGKIGTEATALAAGRGHQVRIATRDPEGARAQLLKSIAPDRITPVKLDVDDADGCARAFEDVDGALLIAPFADMLGWHEKVVRGAEKAGGVSMLAKVSVTGARAPDNDPPPGQLPLTHWKGEELCRASSIATTAIRPTIFAQHFLMGTGMYERGESEFWMPTGEAKVAWLDCRDIARCGLALLELDAPGRQAWDGKAFELTGPRGVTASEVSTTLARLTGQPFRWHDGMDAFVERCATLGKPDRIKGIYGEAAGGWFGEPKLSEFEELCGRRTNSFAKFAIDHAAYFGG